MTSLTQQVLRSRLVWRLSGLSIPTAINATTGRWLNVRAYLGACRTEMSRWSAYFPPGSTALDFGSGVGGNLLGLADRVSYGLGIDVNPLYTRWANLLAESEAARNISFNSYDGAHIPVQIGTFKRIYSIGVFERIPLDRAAALIRGLLRHLDPAGLMLLGFLTERAKGTWFTRRLGESAYTFWTERDVSELATGLQVKSQKVDRPRLPSDPQSDVLRAPHDYYLLRLTGDVEDPDEPVG